MFFFLLIIPKSSPQTCYLAEHWCKRLISVINGSFHKFIELFYPKTLTICGWKCLPLTPLLRHFFSQQFKRSTPALLLSLIKWMTFCFGWTNFGSLLLDTGSIFWVAAAGLNVFLFLIVALSKAKHGQLGWFWVLHYDCLLRKFFNLEQPSRCHRRSNHCNSKSMGFYIIQLRI